MIKRLLKNLRQKPKALRDNIALGLAGGFTAVVALLWLYQLPTRYIEIEQKTPGQDSSGFANLFTNFKDQFASVKQSQSVQPTTTATNTTPRLEDNRPAAGENSVSVENWALATTSANSANTTIDNSATTTPPAPTNPTPTIRIATTSATATESQ